jgi:hypothetical protein
VRPSAAPYMESKDGALLPLNSRFPPSAPHTGQVAFTTSGVPTPAGFIHFRILLAFGYGSLLLPLLRSECPECLNPFPLCPALPDSLDGRHSVEYYGFGVPTRAWVTYPPIPKEVRAGSSVAHTAVSPLTLGALPFPLRPANRPEKPLQWDKWSHWLRLPPAGFGGMWSRRSLNLSFLIDFLPPHSSRV